MEEFNRIISMLSDINRIFYQRYNSVIKIYFESIGDKAILQVDSLNGYHHWCTIIDDPEILIKGEIFKMYEEELIKNAIERNY